MAKFSLISLGRHHKNNPKNFKLWVRFGGRSWVWVSIFGVKTSKKWLLLKANVRQKKIKPNDPLVAKNTMKLGVFFWWYFFLVACLFGLIPVFIDFNLHKIKRGINFASFWTENQIWVNTTLERFWCLINIQLVLFLRCKCFNIQMQKICLKTFYSWSN